MLPSARWLSINSSFVVPLKRAIRTRHCGYPYKSLPNNTAAALFSLPSWNKPNFFKITGISSRIVVSGSLPFRIPSRTAPRMAFSSKSVIFRSEFIIASHPYFPPLSIKRWLYRSCGIKVVVLSMRI